MFLSYETWLEIMTFSERQNYQRYISHSKSIHSLFHILVAYLALNATVSSSFSLNESFSYYNERKITAVANIIH